MTTTAVSKVPSEKISSLLLIGCVTSQGRIPLAGGHSHGALVYPTRVLVVWWDHSISKSRASFYVLLSDRAPFCLSRCDCFHHH